MIQTCRRRSSSLRRIAFLLLLMLLITGCSGDKYTNTTFAQIVAHGEEYVETQKLVRIQGTGIFRLHSTDNGTLRLQLVDGVSTMIDDLSESYIVYYSSSVVDFDEALLYALPDVDSFYSSFDTNTELTPIFVLHVIIEGSIIGVTSDTGQVVGIWAHSIRLLD